MAKRRDTLLELIGQAGKVERNDISRRHDAVLAVASGKRAKRPIERARDLLGRFKSGVPDLGVRHREHLIKRLRRAR